MAGSPHPEWKSADVVRRVRLHTERGTAAAARLIASQLRVTLNVPGNGVASRAPKPPHRQSGALHGGVGVERRSEATFWAGVVDADQHPKAVRLARGFKGTDSLGRRYNQRPRPYVTPTVRRLQNRIVAHVAGGR